ncbi:reverse transcriptase domain-containing protein [Tanacetum coccineum]
MPTWCHMFNYTLTGNARVWFDDLPKESIDSYDDLKKSFLENYLQLKKCIKDSVKIHNIRQRDGESTEEFVRRYKLECRDVKGAPECMKISGFMHGITNPELIKRLHDKIPKSVDEMMRVTTSFLRRENNGKEQLKVTKKEEASGKDKALAILMVQPWERVARKKITQSFSPSTDISFPPLDEDEGTEGPMIIKAEIGGHCIHRMYVDGGSASEILANRTIGNNRRRRALRFSLDEFCGRKITIPVQWNYWKTWSQEVVRSHVNNSRNAKDPGRRGNNHLKSSRLVPQECAMVSGPEGTPSATKPITEERVKVAINPEYPEQTVMIGSTLTEEGRNKLCGLLQRNLDIFAWKPADMTGVPRHITKHCLNVREGCSPVRQKKRGQAADRNQAIQEEVGKLMEAGIMKEVHYHDWLSNPIMVKKHDERMPRKPINDWWITFHKQIGKNLEVYVDDLVIKSRTEDKIVRDIEETFKTLKEINMKLNPKKCTFGVEEGMFLGYKVNTRGLKVCPDKVDAVLSLPSPKCLKDVQKLNRKLASLNRFLAKSAEKSLPFFKTLKKCTKKSDFHWTTEAEEAFKQMKQLIAELPMLMAPMEKEELIVYLAAAKRRALRGPKLNYTSMEKLVLALVHASKRLKRYFQAHKIIVVMDQPIQQILSRPEVAGRLQKWSIELGEYAIHYRPRVSVKGHILADFIVERPEDNSSDTPMETEEELPELWILFTDGSSCTDGSGAGLILTNLEGMEFTYALRFRFDATNNEAEYEALIDGLRISEQMGVKNLQANVDSRLVANQVNGTYVAKEADMIRYLEKVRALTGSFKAFSIKQIPRSENKKVDALSKIASTSFAHLSKQVLVEELKEKSINEVEILAVVEEEGDTWMTPLFKYLAEGTLLA